LKLLLDMNLSPALAPMLASAGHLVRHWSSVGDPRAPDSVVLEWCRTNDHVLITNDLGFGAILAAAGATAPSVLQVRDHDLAPNRLLPVLLSALQQFRSALEQRALISVDPRRTRVRVLPIGQS
jgi:predicted nuclease of predicted toxin-antitoxin system